MTALNIKRSLTAGVLILTLGLLFTPGHSAAASGKAWLGVSLQDLDRDLRDALDLDRGVRGTVINSVVDDSPADDAGLRSNDVITEVDGRSVRDFEDLVEVLRDREPGDRVDITVLRGDRERTFDVRLGDAEDAETMNWFFSDDEGDNSFFSRDGGSIVIDLDDLRGRDWREMLEEHGLDIEEDGGRIEITLPEDDDERRIIILGDDDDDRHTWRRDRDRDRDRDRKHERRLREERWSSRDAAYLGVYTETLGKQLAEFFGTSEGHGVLIEGVVDDSPAKDAGFRAGDVILRVNGEDIDSPSELMREIRGYEAGDEVEIEYLRDKKKRTAKVALGEAEDFGMIAPMSPEHAEHLAHLKHELHAMAPKLHVLKPRLHEMRDDLHLQLRELHDTLPQEELHRLKEQINGEVREAMREMERALRESKLELEEHGRRLHQDL